LYQRDQDVIFNIFLILRADDLAFIFFLHSNIKQIQGKKSDNCVMKLLSCLFVGYIWSPDSGPLNARCTPGSDPLTRLTVTTSGHYTKNQYRIPDKYPRTNIPSNTLYPRAMIALTKLFHSFLTFPKFPSPEEMFLRITMTPFLRAAGHLCQNLTAKLLYGQLATYRFNV